VIHRLSLLVARGSSQVPQAVRGHEATSSYFLSIQTGGSQAGDLRCETNHLERPNAIPVHVYLVPLQAVPGRSGMRMMIVVPSFTKGQKGNKPVIGGIISRRKGSSAPDVSC